MKSLTNLYVSLKGFLKIMYQCHFYEYIYFPVPFLNIIYSLFFILSSLYHAVHSLNYYVLLWFFFLDFWRYIFRAVLSSYKNWGEGTEIFHAHPGPIRHALVLYELPPLELYICCSWWAYIDKALLSILYYGSFLALYSLWV